MASLALDIDTEKAVLTAHLTLVVEGLTPVVGQGIAPPSLYVWLVLKTLTH